jgi:peptidyl-prolyl cis-trans isomerase B (cyclophilin B)
MAAHPMAPWQAVRRLGVAALLVCSAALGCARREEGATGESAVPAGKTSPAVAAAPSAAPLRRLQQPFSEATIADLPDQYLPDRTLAGKSVGKLYEEVVRRWDQVSLAGPQGTLHWMATIDTELGIIEIDLLPDSAPNHVRNFLVLAQCGYYDGLVFERTISEQSDAEPLSRVELIEAGCPAGIGLPGYGSIGYWLRPEFSDQLVHEEGTVGACRGEDPESAACRFYITLSKAPVMDREHTIFGKVSRGLDVVRRIATQPVSNSPEYPLGDRPEKPVVMRKVTVQVRPPAAPLVNQRR